MKEWERLGSGVEVCVLHDFDVNLLPLFNPPPLSLSLPPSPPSSSLPSPLLEEFDSYIVVSFMNATLILSIGEMVEEVTDSGFLGTTPTLTCSQLGDDALIQVLGHV